MASKKVSPVVLTLVLETLGKKGNLYGLRLNGAPLTSANKPSEVTLAVLRAYGSFNFSRKAWYVASTKVTAFCAAFETLAKTNKIQDLIVAREIAAPSPSAKAVSVRGAQTAPKETAKSQPGLVKLGQESGDRAKVALTDLQIAQLIALGWDAARIQAIQA